MNNYKIIIEIFGITRQITIEANNEGEALNKVKQKLWSITKIEVNKVPNILEDISDIPDFLKDMLGIF